MMRIWWLNHHTLPALDSAEVLTHISKWNMCLGGVVAQILEIP